MTRTILNHALWSFGLLAQVILMARIIATRKFRLVILLPIWLAFNVTRSLLLFLLPTHIPSDDYASLYITLAIVGALLEIALALELSWRIHRAKNRSTYELLFIAIAAWLLTLVFANTLPITQLPIDRLEIFADLLFLALGIQTLRLRESGYRAKVSLGLAIFGLADLVSTAGKSTAALRYSTHQFSAWSYLNSGIWILVICIWLFTLFRTTSR